MKYHIEAVKHSMFASKFEGIPISFLVSYLIQNFLRLRMSVLNENRNVLDPA